MEAGSHLWLALRGGSEAPLWLEVKEQGGGEEVVGADKSTGLDGPWDGQARGGVCIGAIGPGPTVMSAAWPRRIGGVRNMGLKLGTNSSMMIKMQNTFI